MRFSSHKIDLCKSGLITTPSLIKLNNRLILLCVAGSSRMRDGGANERNEQGKITFLDLDKKGWYRF